MWILSTKVQSDEPLSRKWITVKPHAKQLRGVAVWGKLEPPLFFLFLYFFLFRFFVILQYLLIFTKIIIIIIIIIIVIIIIITTIIIM